MKKVVIVREGQWGLVKKESYEEFIEILKEILEKAVSPDGKEKIAEVEVVETSAEALLKLRMGGIDTLIFISRDKLAEARQIKKVHRRLKVVLFTGLIPEEEIILVDKGWLLDSREIKHIVLY
ncbi:MAG: hypothetical protein A3I88_00145 [Candidatus Portnoybacteria bacterium RIFCSPLOWO2_12_FULL_39_9]|uniref:Uncharacterized protein n=1 Tax=Candidatus Portnoybacteria bacterium RIFCSPHIGHO2_12_FULL_38_9 TaxID=1801997 RepID=A0A1G2FIC0_9BACT|nr:MAG: hypothetical protein A3H00_01850 [Candidatus Portnoybacteria bacterium RBG_13_40_8]OGZ36475.1 MAG: hypothetical protein A2646_01400 [Candidatus Portnoybacteria bacterium RIFCSPHIGHO2_02_FULL_39_12]OGZ37400.1 MAG: hypothetical protein A3J64_01665 [Candidatus Portnoybacteria bacterium RIFCSPHIGHO2_12_FULL_38_9]OGZ39274.1 MAG: hypothetical protein A3F21_01670 [Candidatus Portnoybacteria bacterium RIFCSPLOWO2_01_FULL_38_39]OGZ41136.1 MAG: hypothetical protein A3I88_00145 [Candidatus Portnoy